MPHAPGTQPFSPDLSRDGYSVFLGLATESRCRELIGHLPEIDASGTRTLLDNESFRKLAVEIRKDLSNRKDLSFVANLIAIQAIYFRKTREHNWALKLHRDRVIPLHGEGPWDGSGLKEGVPCVRPELAFLDRCLTVRLSLDHAADGDLLVVPGTHQRHVAPDREEAIPVSIPAGGALLMRPTLLHGSAKLVRSTARRVLHFLFAPRELPDDYSYHWSV